MNLEAPQSDGSTVVMEKTAEPISESTTEPTIEMNPTATETGNPIPALEQPIQGIDKTAERQANIDNTYNERINGIKEGFRGMFNRVKNVGSKISNGLSKFGKFAVTADKYAQNAVDQGKDMVDGAVASGKEFVQTTKDKGANMWNKLKDGTKEKINNIVGKYNNIRDRIGQKINGVIVGTQNRVETIKNNASTKMNVAMERVKDPALRMAMQREINGNVQKVVSEENTLKIVDLDIEKTQAKLNWLKNELRPKIAERLAQANKNLESQYSVDGQVEGAYGAGI